MEITKAQKAEIHRLMIKEGLSYVNARKKLYWKFERSQKKEVK